MIETRTQHAKRNVISGLVNGVVILFFPFMIRTAIISYLGTEYLGLDSLFKAVLQVLNMAELGFSSAATYSLYKPLAKNDDDKICAYLAIYKRIYRTIGITILVIGACILPFLPYLIKGTYPIEINIYCLYIIYLLNTVVSYLFCGYRTVLLSATQKQNIISNIDTIIGIIKSIMQILVIVLFKDYYFFSIIFLLSTIANNFVVGIVVQKMYPQYICRGTLEDEEKKDMQKMVAGLAIGRIGALSRNSFDNIVLSLFCGLKEVAIYGNYYYIYSAVNAIHSIFVEAIAAGVGDCVARKDKDMNYQDFEKIHFYFSWFGSWCTITMCCLYQSFMQIWVGNEFVVNEDTMILFCIYYYITQIGFARSVYGRACGIWWNTKYYAILEVLFNLVLNFGLGYIWGMNGILLATIISVCIFNIVLSGKKVINICFDRSSKEYFKNNVYYALLTFLVGIVAYNICERLSGNIYVMIVNKILICIAVPNIIFALVSFGHKKYRMYLKEFIDRIK